MAVAFAVAAIGIPLQILGGVDYPVVRPGLIMLVVAAATVAFVRWRWMPAVALVVTAFMLFGFFGPYLDQTMDRLAAPSDVATWAGTLIQLVGCVVSLFAGLFALRSGDRHARET